jgi:hypothetical protein
VSSSSSFTGSKIVGPHAVASTSAASTVLERASPLVNGARAGAKGAITRGVGGARIARS